MPKRSSTRAAAALMSGASPGCTQPCQMSILRLCIPGPGTGHPPVRNAHAQVSGQQRSQGLPGAQQCSEPVPVRYQCT